MEINLNINVKTMLLSIVIILVTLEISPYLLDSFFLGKPFSRKEIRNELSQFKLNDSLTDQGAGTIESYLSEHILHPYLGFIHEPDQSYNEFGFPEDDPFPEDSPDNINICITGGSVSKQLFQVSGETIRQKLELHPAFKNKTINIVSVSLGGFKQPQQLIALNYLISLGARYDYVLNIDGFNEVVLPYSDNLPFGIHPSFPRHWNIYSRKALDKKTTSLLGRQVYLKQEQNKQKLHFAGSIFRISNFALFLWKITDQETDLQIVETEMALRNALGDDEMDIQTSGPEYTFSDTLSFFSDQVNLWSQCSRQINGLANESGFRYFHFLQPNQYFEDSKTLTQEELSIAYEKGEFIYKEAVSMAYPMLVEEGHSLKNSGIRFIDLTRMFVNETSTVYSDKCCHFNKKGYDAIADIIVRTIVSEYD